MGNDANKNHAFKITYAELDQILYLENLYMKDKLTKQELSKCFPCIDVESLEQEKKSTVKKRHFFKWFDMSKNSVGDVFKSIAEQELLNPYKSKKNRGIDESKFLSELEAQELAAALSSCSEEEEYEEDDEEEDEEDNENDDNNDNSDNDKYNKNAKKKKEEEEEDQKSDSDDLYTESQYHKNKVNKGDRRRSRRSIRSIKSNKLKDKVNNENNLNENININNIINKNKEEIKLNSNFKPITKEELKKYKFDKKIADVIKKNEISASEIGLRNYYEMFNLHFESRVVKAPPLSFRWLGWLIVSELPAARSDLYYKVLLTFPLSEKDEEQIKKDIDRTLESQNYDNALEIKESLFRILKAIAILDKDLGYVQGMNFLSSFFLIISNRNEVDTFYFLMGLFSQTFCDKFGMRDFYTEGFPLIQVFENLFNRKLQKHFKNLYNHIQKIDLPSNGWIIPMMQTLFVGVLPTACLLRVWDVFFVIGLPFILSFSLSLCEVIEKDFLQLTDLSDITEYIKVLNPEKTNNFKDRNKKVNYDIEVMIKNALNKYSVDFSEIDDEIDKLYPDLNRDFRYVFRNIAPYDGPAYEENIPFTQNSYKSNNSNTKLNNDLRKSKEKAGELNINDVLNLDDKVNEIDIGSKNNKISFNERNSNQLRSRNAPNSLKDQNNSKNGSMNKSNSLAKDSINNNNDKNTKKSKDNNRYLDKDSNCNSEDEYKNNDDALTLKNKDNFINDNDENNNNFEILNNNNRDYNDNNNYNNNIDNYNNNDNNENNNSINDLNHIRNKNGEGDLEVEPDEFEVSDEAEDDFLCAIKNLTLFNRISKIIPARIRKNMRKQKRKSIKSRCSKASNRSKTSLGSKKYYEDN